jgi:hypothetical protein
MVARKLGQKSPRMMNPRVRYKWGGSVLYRTWYREGGKAEWYMHGDSVPIFEHARNLFLAPSTSDFSSCLVIMVGGRMRIIIIITSVIGVGGDGHASRTREWEGDVE